MSDIGLSLFSVGVTYFSGGETEAHISLGPVPSSVEPTHDARAKLLHQCLVRLVAGQDYTLKDFEEVPGLRYSNLNVLAAKPEKLIAMSAAPKLTAFEKKHKTEWSEKPEYFLAEEWDWVADEEDFPELLRKRIDRRRERATPEFRRRNILYEGRNLIRL